MQQPQNGRSRKYAVVVKRYCKEYPVGTRLQMRVKRFEELKDFVKEYIGPWPPKKKTKFNLKDLK